MSASVHQKTRSRKFPEGLFVTGKHWKQPKCQSSRTDSYLYIHIMTTQQWKRLTFCHKHQPRSHSQIIKQKKSQNSTCCIIPLIKTLKTSKIINNDGSQNNGHFYGILAGKGHERAFWAAGNVLYLNMGWWLYRSLHVKFHCAFKIYVLYCMSLYFNTHTHTFFPGRNSQWGGEVHESSSWGERRCGKAAREGRGALMFHFA